MKHLKNEKYCVVFYWKKKKMEEKWNIFQKNRIFQEF